MESIKSNEAPQKPSETRRRMTIAHLNDDCLEKVFSYLDLKNLTNVADANVHLAKSACTVFWYEYRHNEINFNCFDPSMMSDDEFLLMLEHFGNSMEKLRVQFCFDDRRNQLIFDGILNNCSANLLELSFGGLQKAMIVNKRFPNLRKLELYDSHFGIHHSFAEISEWFPKLSSLQLSDNKGFWEDISVDQFIPTLQHFGYFTFPSQSHSKNSLKKIATFLNANPQLTSLGLDEIGDEEMCAEFYRYAPHEFPIVERLEVVSPHPFPNGPIRFNNLKELKLSFYADTLDITEHLPAEIECLELRIPSLSASNMRMITNCQQLTKLKLILNTDLVRWQMEKLVNDIKSLTEINIVLNTCEELGKTQTLVALEQFFVHGKRMKKIGLEYEVAAFDVEDTLYSNQIEIATQFTQAINDSNKLNWQIGHKIRISSDDNRTKDLFTYPYLQFSFNKM